MSIHDLIVPLGIFTYAMVLLGVLTGTRVIKVKFNWHKRIGLTILIVATLHATIVIYSNYF